MAENEKTEHFRIVKPHQDNNVSEEVFKIQQAIDTIDALFRAVALDLLKKMDSDAALAIENISGLTAALANKMAKDRTFKLVEMTDLTGVENALDNYILTKAGAGFVLRSALAVIGVHTHDIANINGLQAVLNTLAAGASGVVEGEITLFHGTTGKALKGSGLKLVDLILSLDGKATSAQLAALADTVATALSQKLDKAETATNSLRLGGETTAQWQAKIDAKAGVYTGSEANEVNFPIGHTLAYRDGDRTANSAVTIRLGNNTGNFSSYQSNGTNTALAGVWRCRGVPGQQGSTGWWGGIAQRTE